MRRVLALDVGEKRTGVAISDETQTLARPLVTLNRASKKEDFAKIVAALAAAGFVHRLVLGVDVFLDGPNSPPSQALHFVWAGQKLDQLSRWWCHI